MSLILIFVILPFKRKRSFNLLIIIEILVLILFVYMYSLSTDRFYSVFFLCIAAAEGRVGLRSLIALVRTTGNTIIEI
jgi:NADH:ubiquinone oxidoreductase subunit K